MRFCSLSTPSLWRGGTVEAWASQDLQDRICGSLHSFPRARPKGGTARGWRGSSQACRHLRPLCTRLPRFYFFPRPTATNSEGNSFDRARPHRAPNAPRLFTPSLPAAGERRKHGPRKIFNTGSSADRFIHSPAPDRREEQRGGGGGASMRSAYHIFDRRRRELSDQSPHLVPLHRPFMEIDRCSSLADANLAAILSNPLPPRKPAIDSHAYGPHLPQQHP